MYYTIIIIVHILFRQIFIFYFPMNFDDDVTTILLTYCVLKFLESNIYLFTGNLQLKWNTDYASAVMNEQQKF